MSFLIIVSGLFTVTTCDINLVSKHSSEPTATFDITNLCEPFMMLLHIAPFYFMYLSSHELLFITLRCTLSVVELLIKLLLKRKRIN